MAGCTFWRPSPEKVAAQIQSEIQREVPLGSDPSIAIKFLDKRHIEHSHYRDSEGDAELERFLGAKGRIDGIIRDV